ncbi:tRNA-uridine aminocarboxypropyltransferase [Undibacterium crateris]|uniref:tRNA-uridine aminocarboxypropyltransferase n=1 Tax=Undibacterium crateris TaxID=2528175 RepID=UPI0013898AB6|nr:tRNA-uridine aminocarboxypropyltransferase [Undibacterium crateris]NDI87061.1 DTW domain-containing protein [Undibacterium crateris]
MSSRETCQHCLRAARNCICHCVSPVHTRHELLILQHPLEVSHVKGSGRLLHLCLPGSSAIMTGEQFEQVALAQALRGDWHSGVAGAAQQSARLTVLLYPDTAESEAQDLHSHGSAWEPSASAPPLRLVVLDATWRKSRKMLYQNPLLQSLPRWSLRQMPASHYRIRKAHQPDQLSTLEASTYALMALQPEADFSPVLQAFDQMVEQQLGWMQQSR